VYWSDYYYKKLWSLPKDGSSRNPVNLRTYRNPAIGVVVYRNEPLNCDLITLPVARNGNASVQKTELIENLVSSPSIALLGFTFICLVIMTIMIVFVLKFFKSKDCKGIRGISKIEDTVSFQLFNNALKMTDLVILND
jgi:hypothetical protein